MAIGEREEATALEFEAALRAAGLTAQAKGRGVHWQVDANTPAGRALRVHCFWYGSALHGLQLGMNPANARSHLRDAPPAPYQGPEYAVTLTEPAARPLEGRTRTLSEAVACARVWLTGATVDELAAQVPFVDAQGRAMRALAATVDPRLRWDVGRDPSYELWVYGEGRSCRVTQASGRVGCALFLGQAQLAWCEAPDVAALTARWLLERASLQALARGTPGLVVERHAELLEHDPAAWHWAHFHERVVDPSDVLAPLREVLEALEQSPVARRFFTFSSLDRLGFSASSHYPWVDEGLPVVARARDGGYAVGAERCADVATAVRRVEAALAACPVTPFFGSAVRLEHQLLCARLLELGSRLEPRLVQAGAWERLEVASADGARRCRVSERSCGHHGAEFFVAGASVQRSWRDFDALVAAVRAFVEQGVAP